MCICSTKFSNFYFTHNTEFCLTHIPGMAHITDDSISHVGPCFLHKRPVNERVDTAD
jgi:hypothetical protein